MSTGTIGFLTRAQYDQLQRVNWSTLKHLADSPAHYRAALMTPMEDTDELQIGRCTHLGVFEPERFRSEVVLWDGAVRRGKEWDKFQALHAGREILTERAYDTVARVAEAVRAHPLAAEYVSRGRSEQTIQWTHVTDSGHRIDCKGRVDFLAAIGSGCAVDLKTTKRAEREAFGREAERYRYDAQAAFYVDGLAAATGQRWPYVIVAAEKKSPYVVQRYRLSEERLERGRRHYRALLELLAECRAANHWPGYSEDEEELSLPAWAEEVDSEGDDLDAVGLKFS